MAFQKFVSEVNVPKTWEQNVCRTLAAFIAEVHSLPKYHAMETADVLHSPPKYPAMETADVLYSPPKYLAMKAAKVFHSTLNILQWKRPMCCIHPPNILQ